MPIWRRLFEHCTRRAASRAYCTAGRSSATSTPIMAITTSSSTRVKPLRSRQLSFRAMTFPLVHCSVIRLSTHATLRSLRSLQVNPRQFAARPFDLHRPRRIGRIRVLSRELIHRLFLRSSLVAHCRRHPDHEYGVFSGGRSVPLPRGLNGHAPIGSNRAIGVTMLPKGVAFTFYRVQNHRGAHSGLSLIKDLP